MSDILKDRDAELDALRRHVTMAAAGADGGERVDDTGNEGGSLADELEGLGRRQSPSPHKKVLPRLPTPGGGKKTSLAVPSNLRDLLGLDEREGGTPAPGTPPAWTSTPIVDVGGGGKARPPSPVSPSMRYDATARFGFRANPSTTRELSFKKGALLVVSPVHGNITEEWWRAVHGESGDVGFVPVSHLQIHDEVGDAPLPAVSEPPVPCLLGLANHPVPCLLGRLRGWREHLV
jgi:hypothetical protein